VFKVTIELQATIECLPTPTNMPFYHVRDLRLSLRIPAVAQHVPLLSSVLRLRLEGDEDGASVYDIGNEDCTFKALRTLTQLQALTTNLMYDEADLATLQCLTQLRKLQITWRRNSPDSSWFVLLS
jgi:hypothetical protein